LKLRQGSLHQAHVRPHHAENPKVLGLKIATLVEPLFETPPRYNGARAARSIGPSGSIPRPASTRSTG
jgi:hypothetical protein